MSSALRELIRGLLVIDGDAVAIAAHASSCCRRLSQHMARLIGELGTRTLFDRAVHLAAPSFPCVATMKDLGVGNPYDGLRICLERETRELSLEAAIHVFVTFIELLERFIGGPLVASLLHEVWPTKFP